MKNININNGLSGFVMLLATVLGASCTKMDYYYKDYLVAKEYIGKIDSVWVVPGNNRALLGWMTPDDPSATALVVYWNDFNDSVMTTLDHDDSLGSVFVEGLTEGEYTFDLVTVDGSGNSSVPVEITSKVYGQTYQNTLTARLLDHLVPLKDSIALFWSAARPDGLIGMEVQYTDQNQQMRNVFFSAEDTLGFIRHVDRTKGVSMRSLFAPDSLVLDTFYTPFKEVSLTEDQMDSLVLIGADATDFDLIDFRLVVVYKLSSLKHPEEVDLSHLRGKSSRHNLLALTSDGYSAWSDAILDSMEQWPGRNRAELINLGNTVESHDLYDRLDENDRAAVVSAFQTVQSTFAPTDRLKDVQTGDIILIHSVDRDLYIAIDVLHSEDAGDLTIAFKVSRY